MTIHRTRKLILASAAILFMSASAALAHDFWLVPDAFQVAPGGWIEVRGQTSSQFPTSESAVALDRIAEARLLAARADEPIRNLSHTGKSLLIRHRPTAPGQRVISVALKPRTARESAAGFRRYLELEGAPEALQRYEWEGRLPKSDSVTRRYTKYAKALVEVGTGGPKAFARLAGHPLEFVPLQDPASLRAGQQVAFRLVYRGRPLAGAPVHGGAAPQGSAAVGAEDEKVASDADGVVRVCLDRPGLWNVRTLHIVPADAGSGADWDAHWATLVFQVPGQASQSPVSCGDSNRSSGRGGVLSDSADAAAVVHRFHQALASGDSAAALTLLAPEAEILESGGVETRAEYRSHHLPGDIAFARTVRSQRGPLQVRVRGDVAWVTSTSTAQGQYRDRAVNSQGAELVVLTRTAAGWRIAAIHWSSRARRP